MSRPYLAALRPSGTHKPRPHQRREHQNPTRQRAVSVMRGGGTTLPHHPTKAPTPKHANTPTRTRPARKHETQPPTEQTRPQQACSSTTRANTRSAHTLLCGRGSVSATGEPWKSRRPARTKRKRPTRARRQRTQKRANNLVCARCAACARKGGQRERRPLTIAHARARGLLCLWACLRTFVGFFGLWVLGVWVFFGGVWRVFWFFDIFGL